MKKLTIAVVKAVNSFIRKAARYFHKLQYRLEWKNDTPPEWFDHFLDQYWQWGKKGVSHWIERGVFGRISLTPQGRLLELCCGDGFNARHFYAEQAASITSVDFDPTAIAHARKHNAHPKIRFELADIRSDMPRGPFDNVIWDAAIEHFTVEEIDAILKNIKRVLVADGICAGFTIVERDDGKKHLHHHEYEFKGKRDLLDILKPHFKTVVVFETKHRGRHNLYFMCSDGEVPFGKGWDGLVSAYK